MSWELLPRKGAPAPLSDSVVQEPGVVKEAHQVLGHPVRSEGDEVIHEESNIKWMVLCGQKALPQKGAPAPLSDSVVQEPGVVKEDSKSV